MKIRERMVKKPNAHGLLIYAGSEVTDMNKEYENEQMYQITMCIVRKMLSEGLVSEEEYHKIDTIFTQKYNPVFGVLFSEY